MIKEETYKKFGPYAPMIKTIRENPISLIPGYSVYEWFKEDKSHLSNEKPFTRRAYIASIYIGAAVRDAGLALIYYGIGAGLVKVIEETSKLIK